MALIKCPECGREISDKAKICPHCGFPISEVQPNAQENTVPDTTPSKPPREKKKMPSWLLALIIVVVLILIGNIVVLCFNYKLTGNGATQVNDTLSKIEQGAVTISGTSSDNCATQDSDTTSKIVQRNVAISKIDGLSIDKFTKYSTKYGKTYYYRKGRLTKLYDGGGNQVLMFESEIMDIAEEGSNIAFVIKDNGSASWLGRYCIEIIDQSDNSEKNGVCGFDDVKISKGNKVFFNTLIHNTPTKLTFSDIIECQGYYEDAVEHLYKKKHTIDYSWMNGEWSLISSIKDPYVGRINIRLTLKIDTKKQTIRMIDEDGGDGYSGTYTVNNSQNMISCNGNYVHFDPNKKQFYEEFQGKRDYYHKKKQ